MAAAKLTAGSLAKLATCHRDLQRLVKALVEDGVALHVICGHRDRLAQDRAFAEGKSKLRFPRSKHNPYPSKAIDLGPLPLLWDDKPAFVALAKLVRAKARELDIAVRWGGDWDGDGVAQEPGEWDLVHWELDAPTAVLKRA